jgi:hypothetical protein
LSAGGGDFDVVGVAGVADELEAEANWSDQT